MTTDNSGWEPQDRSVMDAYAATLPTVTVLMTGIWDTAIELRESVMYRQHPAWPKFKRHGLRRKR